MGAGIPTLLLFRGLGLFPLTFVVLLSAQTKFLFELLITAVTVKEAKFLITAVTYAYRRVVGLFPLIADGHENKLWPKAILRHATRL